MISRPQQRMPMIRKSDLRRLPWMALCCLVLMTGAWAQDSGSQPPLGDVVRRQQEQRQHSKTAKKVVTDEDMPANRMHWTRDQVAEFVIIPAVQISGMVPNGDSSTAPVMGQKNDKIYVSFGPHLGQADSCGSLDCGEQFLGRFQRGKLAGSKARILFDSDEVVDGYQARVAHFEVVHDVLGKMQGSVAFIATGVATLTAACMYNFDDWAEAAPECDAFISSLRINVPQKYIYVGQ